MNTRLEAALMLKMANASLGVWVDNESAIEDADALIAEEARTRKPEADDPAIGVVCMLVKAKGNTYLVPVDVADELAKLREVAEQLAVALETSCQWHKKEGVAFVAGESALAAARDLGLGGGK